MSVQQIKAGKTYKLKLRVVLRRINEPPKPKHFRTLKQHMWAV